jgi:drug/metabolite transporter (DMT)-like permease
MNFMWILYSIVASVLWGLDYALAGKLLEKIGFSTLLGLEFFFGFLAMLGISLTSGAYKADFQTLISSKQTVVWFALMIAVFVIAHTLIVLSIENKSATLASLIEMSYPFFVAGFSWLLFEEGKMNLGTIVGGLLIFGGVSLIYFLNK